MEVKYKEKEEKFDSEIKKEFFILEKDKKIISVISSQREDKGHIANLYYEKNCESLYIGKGYATALIKECVNELKKAGVKEIKLLACANKHSETDKRLNKKQLIRFYRKQGFKREPLKEELLKYSKRFTKKELILMLMDQNVIPMILKF